MTTAFTVATIATPFLALVAGWFTAVVPYGPHKNTKDLNKLNVVLIFAFLLLGTIEGTCMWVYNCFWYPPTPAEMATFTQPIFIATAADPVKAWVIAISIGFTFGGSAFVFYLIGIGARRRFVGWYRLYRLKRDNKLFWKKMSKEVNIPGTQKTSYPCARQTACRDISHQAIKRL